MTLLDSSRGPAHMRWSEATTWTTVTAGHGMRSGRRRAAGQSRLGAGRGGVDCGRTGTFSNLLAGDRAGPSASLGQWGGGPAEGCRAVRGRKTGDGMLFWSGIQTGPRGSGYGGVEASVRQASAGIAAPGKQRIQLAAGDGGSVKHRVEVVILDSLIPG